MSSEDRAKAPKKIAPKRFYIDPVRHFPAKAELARHGISCEGKRARKIKREDYGAFDAIVTMEERNSAAAKRFFGGDPDGKIRRLLDYTDRPRDIADPWWTGDFARTYSDIEEGTEALLKRLRDR